MASWTAPGATTHGVHIHPGGEVLFYTAYQWLNSLPAATRPTNIGIPYYNASPFTTDAATGAVELGQAYGYKIVLNEAYTAAVTDFTPIIEAAEAANVQVFLHSSTTSNDSLLAIHAMEQVGWQPGAYEDFETEGPWWVNSATGKEYPDVNYSINLATAWPGDPDPPYHDLAYWQNWYINTKHYTSVPSWNIEAFCAAPQVLEAAVQGSGSLDQKTLLNYVETHSFYTTKGQMEYPAPYHFGHGYRERLAQILGDGTMQTIWCPPGLTPTGTAVYPRPPWSQVTSTSTST